MDLYAFFKLYRVNKVLTKQSNSHYDNSSGNNSSKTYSALKPHKYLSSLFNEFNDYSSQYHKDNENAISYKYYNIDQIQTLNKLCLFSIEYIIGKTKINFDVIAISESRIFKNRFARSDDLKNCS